MGRTLNIGFGGKGFTPLLEETLVENLDYVNQIGDTMKSICPTNGMSMMSKDDDGVKKKKVKLAMPMIGKGKKKLSFMGKGGK